MRYVIKYWDKIKKFLKEALYIGLAILYFKIFGLGLGFMLLIGFAIFLVFWVKSGKKELPSGEQGERKIEIDIEDNEKVEG